MTVTSFRHVGYVVSDLDASLRFYAGLLGLSIYQRRIEEGMFIERLTGLKGVKLEWVKLAIPQGGLIELLYYHHPPSSVAVPAIRPANAIGCSHVALTVRDLPGLYRTLTANGHQCASEPLVAPNGLVRALYCHDPDGSIVELIEDLGPARLPIQAD